MLLCNIAPFSLVEGDSHLGQMLDGMLNLLGSGYTLLADFKTVLVLTIFTIRATPYSKI